jgi:hypothetical protein
MVAGIDIAVVLNDQGRSAGALKYTNAGLPSNPGFQCYVKELDKHLPDIMARPIVKYRAKKLSILQRLDRPV